MCCIKTKNFFPNINYYIRKLFLLDYQIEDFTGSTTQSGFLQDSWYIQ